MSNANRADFVTPDERRGTSLTYEFTIRRTLLPNRPGWHDVLLRYGGGGWQVVASVFGERRAEIVRDALSAGANERV